MKVSDLDKVCTLDIECDSLTPTKIWVCNLYDHKTENHIPFYEGEQKDLERELKYYDKIVCHNGIDFDFPVLKKLWNVSVDQDKVIDTLVLSRLLKVQREEGHSLEAWGTTLGFPKLEFSKWDELTAEMILYCQRDCEVNAKLYNYLWDRWFCKPEWEMPVKIEMKQAWICARLHTDGFPFNYDEALKLKKELEEELSRLLDQMQKDFPPKEKITVLKTKIKTEMIPFNPNSPQQVIDRLHELGWKPVDKTDGHIDILKDRTKSKEEKAKKLERYKKYGWKLNEKNLATLPEDCPSSIHSFLRYTILESRLSTLTEWFKAYNQNTGKIHGTFFSIGTWTHRKIHTNPNMGNIPTAKSIKFKQPELYDLCLDYGKRMRQLWFKGDANYMIGCDAEGIQLRVFAHLIDDQKLIKAIVEGKKEDGTDIHSINQKALGEVCKTRDSAKTFIYAFFLGASPTKVAEIFGCSKREADEAIEKFLEFYPGLKDLKKNRIPFEAKRGYMEGLDGRKIACDSEHLMLACHLQNGEAVIMKLANNLWRQELASRWYHFVQVNDVHDEYVTLSYENLERTHEMGKIQCASITKAGEILNLRCPLSGSYSIGNNWHEVH